MIQIKVTHSPEGTSNAAIAATYVDDAYDCGEGVMIKLELQKEAVSMAVRFALHNMGEKKIRSDEFFGMKQPTIEVVLRAA